MLLCRPDNLLNATEMRHAKFLVEEPVAFHLEGFFGIMQVDKRLRLCREY